MGEFNHKQAADRVAATIKLINENHDLLAANVLLTGKNAEFEEELKRVIRECYSVQGEAAVEMMLPAWQGAAEIVRGKMSTLGELTTMANANQGVREGKLCRSCASQLDSGGEQCPTNA